MALSQGYRVTTAASHSALVGIVTKAEGAQLIDRGEVSTTPDANDRDCDIRSSRNFAQKSNAAHISSIHASFTRSDFILALVLIGTEVVVLMCVELVDCEGLWDVRVVG